MLNQAEKVNLNYEKSYVAFLDVLGFKNLVYSQKQEDRRKIEFYLNEVQESLERLKKVSSKQKIGSITISDSVILTIPFGDNPSDSVNNLRQLCIAILGIQRRLSKKNIWIRGAVSCGDSHFDGTNNQIVGPAYIDAYLLEETIAKYPRVILDTRIIRELSFNNSTDLINEVNSLNLTNPNRYKEDVLYDWNRRASFLAQLEKDIPLFIDYMSRDIEDLQAVLLFIEDNVRKNISLFKKFQWVSKYVRTITDDNNLLKKFFQI